MPRSAKHVKTCHLCERPAAVRGLCRRCYTWENYHLKKRHGAAYFQLYVRHHESLVYRGQTRLESLAGPRRRVA